MSPEIILFCCAAAAAVVSAIGMVTRANPVKGALLLIVNFFCLAVLYLILQAQFIAIIQILVYAGAIMVLFLFVLMLLNLRDETFFSERKSIRKLIGIILAAVLLAEVVAGLGLSFVGSGASLPPHAAEKGTVQYIGMALYKQFLFPFEITSILLIAAMVGIIVLARKRVD
jgi:NADH-quinone oxidoreductase subunit J